MRSRYLLIAVLLLSVCFGAARAQGRGGPGGGPGGGGLGAGAGAPGNGTGGNGVGGNGAGQPGPGGMPGAGRGGAAAASGAGRNGSGGSQQLGLGRWWDDKGKASALNLRPDQKRAMDAIFNASRPELTSRLEALRQAESQLQAATGTTRLSGEGLFGQINQVAEARDALQNVTVRLAEQLQAQLDDEQRARLKTLR